MEQSAEPRKYLSFDEIVAHEEAAEMPEEVRIRAWGELPILIRPLKVRELERIEKLATNIETGDKDEQRQKVLILQETLVEPKLEYTQILKLISDFRAVPVQQLWNAVNRINGIGREATDEADKSVSD